MGREMNVTIGGVSDRHHNAMKSDEPIRFSKNIANLNLNEVSSSFTFTLNTATCTLDTEAIQSEIAAILTLYDSSRINIDSARCLGTSTEATVTIGPAAASGVRRKLSENTTHSLDLFHSLQQVSKNETHGGRMLADSDGTNKLAGFTVRNLRVIPGASDAPLFKTTAAQVRQEEMIRHGTGDADNFIQEERMLRIGEKLEEQMELWSEKSAAVVGTDDTHTLDVVLEEVRLEREEWRKELKKQNRMLLEKSASEVGADDAHTLDAVLEVMRLERVETLEEQNRERQDMRKELKKQNRMLLLAVGVGVVSSVLLYLKKG
jgi:hypothetical protein